jgi:hypothetical protein
MYTLNNKFVGILNLHEVTNLLVVLTNLFLFTIAVKNKRNIPRALRREKTRANQIETIMPHVYAYSNHNTLLYSCQLPCREKSFIRTV